MEFYKYQGTGNDFVMVDNRDLTFPKSTSLIAQLCDRRFGIGGDGLILLENDDQYDFRMVYYNADGNESTMCGNGGRCLVSFAHFLNIFENKTSFMAIDGLHEAEVNGDLVKLKMIDVEDINTFPEYTVMNTGSPHYVAFVEHVEDMDVYLEGKKIRNNETFKKEGINVNFVTQTSENELFVRTYERGVEDETYSCGTGVTASALTFMQNHNQTPVHIKVLGGILKVYAEKAEKGFRNIWLEGPAKQVFKGNLEVK
ncbi:diaminopimelate epimerase [Elizabethkingia anophelis]|uniref:Diaminopimelate epimerase n=2 Tax=Elizabethkingia anophelis TaxID=1117645 RepID=A0AAE4P464_9FLAO|nr:MULTISPECIES: diaminopimelate epimerase [Elizabethkingia]AQW91823.1 diaminopimelate epimerase [Elizabethkingia anophelis]ATC35506.1 diaminopimelate epimerase [Elizabethkingia anophelis R26]ATC39144.1 diaminopimelate epimerase [Elizabethkingia anophelis Ag1]ATC42825.1 diaminopimelate epimerase [Elizabethkingia anophelis]ATC46501.1 diaminopimelate epimerase [Elizabethkingia anophelis]